MWDDAQELIAKLLSEDVADRPQAWVDVLEDPFLRKVDEEGVPPVDNYQGLTNKEDYEQVERATTVNIISTSWITNKAGASKAVATKIYHDNPSAGVYTFNPNSGLRAAAMAEKMSAEE